MTEPWKDCPDECRLSRTPSMITMAYYPPIYDKHGNNLNSDRNAESFSVECLTCKKRWSASRIGDDPATYREVTEGRNGGQGMSV